MRTKLKLKLVLSEYTIFKSIYKMFSKVHQNLVREDTNIVIEGFPRCGNTFAVASFKHSNQDLEIASHVHLPYQIIFSKKYKTPAIFLIRNPLDSISSLMIRDSKYTIQDAILYYIKFHQIVIKYKTHAIISDFTSTINDFPSIIKKLNNKMGTNFQYHDNTKETILKIKNHLKQEEIEKYGKGYEKVFGLPSNKRDKEKSQLISEIKKNKNYKLANEMYSSLVNHSSINQ